MSAVAVDLTPPRGARAPRASIGRVLTETSTMVGRSIRLARRHVDTLVMAMLLPLMIMALFVYVFGGAIDRSGDYVNYVVPGIVLLCVGFGAASTAVPVAADVNDGMIDRLRSMPIHPAAVLAGHVAASVVRNAVSTMIVVVAALAMGFRPDATPLEWLALAALLTVYVLALSWLAAGLGTVAGNAEAASMAGFFMLFVPYMSSALCRRRPCQGRSGRSATTSRSPPSSGPPEACSPAIRSATTPGSPSSGRSDSSPWA
jgi:ABC-2 type transport system permease protein